MDNVNLTGLSATTVVRWQTELEHTIQDADLKIAQLQKERAAALEDLAVVKNALIQSGHTSLEIPQLALPAPTAAKTVTPVTTAADVPRIKRKYTKREPVVKAAIVRKKKDTITAKSEYNTEWSTNDKITWELLNNGKKMPLRELTNNLVNREPNNKKLKDIATIISQNLNTRYTRTPTSDVNNPVVKLIK
jgi:hypothetical protein